MKTTSTNTKKHAARNKPARVGGYILSFIRNAVNGGNEVTVNEDFHSLSQAENYAEVKELLSKHYQVWCKLPDNRNLRYDGQGTWTKC